MTEQENWYSFEVRKLLKKERYFSGSHHYFFEVKEAKNGSKYIIIDQRKKVKDQFIGSKIRIFEDEMLEFERIFSNLVKFALNNDNSNNHTITNDPKYDKFNDLDLNPTFFDKLSSTKNWKEFEKYTYYLLKLLGISTLYNFLDERQAGKADGFFKIGNLAVIYDCTLAKGDIEENKSEQINNYCNRLQQGSINISENTKEEFFTHNKQVWIITQRETKQIKTINLITVKEIAVKDLISLYQERLTEMLNNQSLELRLCNL